MATSNIDALYAELYPEKTSSRTIPKASSFDDYGPSPCKGGMPVLSAPSKSGETTINRKAPANDFDSDEDVSPICNRIHGAPSPAALTTTTVSAATLNTVPFPNVSHPIYDQILAHYRCSQAFRCYVCSPCNKPSAPPAGEAERLRELFVTNNSPQAAAHQAKDPRLHQDLLRRKGAFHVCAPQRGNGCCDYTHQSSTNRGSDDPTATAGALGGCPFLTCRKCDHPVVRADGVRWYGSKLVEGQQALDETSEPETDLYLVIRNYYPDWSRLATARLVGGGALVSASTNAAVSASPTLLPVTSAGTANAGPSRSNIDAFDDDDDEDESTIRAATSNLMPTVPTPTPIASPSPNGASDASGAYALVSDETASAYCCQCTWLSVKQTPVGAAINTTVADAALFAHTVKDSSVLTPFIPVLNNGAPVDFVRYAKEKKKRRLPLWVCKGHLA